MVWTSNYKLNYLRIKSISIPTVLTKFNKGDIESVNTNI
jgi:hypothetical protein